jgi:hypothetical protein
MVKSKRLQGVGLDDINRELTGNSGGDTSQEATELETGIILLRTTLSSACGFVSV